MINKRFMVLVAAVIAAVILATVLVLNRAPEAEGSLAGEAVLPGLDEKINEVDTLRLVQAGDATLLTLKREGDGWVVAERDGYRADAGKVRTALLNLAQTRVIEAKTANPERYAQLGVEDVESEAAQGARVELGGQGIDHRLIVGNSAQSTGTYVRLAGQAQSLLAAGNLMPDKEVGAWLEKAIADISSSRIREIELKKGDGPTLRVFKENSGDANFKVADVPRGREVQSDVVANGLGSMLSGLTLDDVRKDAEGAQGDHVLHRARYALFDGVTVSIEGWKDADSEDGASGSGWIRLNATLDEDVARAAITAGLEQEQAAAVAQGEAEQAVAESDEAASDTQDSTVPTIDVEARTTEALAGLRKEVEDLNALASGWLFRIPAFKFTNIDKSVEDMLKPKD